MRELKFRAWHKKLNRYLEPHEFYITPIGEVATACFTTLDGEVIAVNSIEDFSCDDFEEGLVILEEDTNLKDKNGEAICEGDIVKCYYYGRMIGIYQVIRNEDIAGYEMEAIEGNPENEDIKDIRSFAEMHLFTRVIGNIHENRELLGDTNVTNKEEG